jgi:hypothetical protein
MNIIKGHETWSALEHLAVKRLVAGLLLVLLVSTGSDAVSVRLAWDAVTSETETVLGYRVYYGTASRVYTLVGDTAEREYQVDNVDVARPIYFAVTAYSETSESGYSTELACAVIRQSVHGSGSIVGAQGDWTAATAAAAFVVEKNTGKSVLLTIAPENPEESVMALRLDSLWISPVTELIIANIAADHTVFAVIGSGLPVLTGIRLVP